MIWIILILWVLIGLLACYSAIVWRDEKGDHIVNHLIDEITGPLLVALLLLTLGIAWPIVFATICLCDRGNDFKIPNPVRWVIREVQKPRENV